ncbi:MAG: hypothetical protein ABIP51_18450 [Bacteroidia bacterium]
MPQTGNSNNYTGKFELVKQLNLVNDTVKEFYGFTKVTLYSKNTPDSVMPIGLDVGNVSINNYNLGKFQEYSSPSFVYGDSLNYIQSKPAYWSISGNSNFSPLTFMDGSNYPTYNGYNLLPDSIALDTSNTFIINNFYGADLIEVQIYPFAIPTKTFQPSSNSVVVTFAKSEMVSLPFGFPTSIPNAAINISFHKNVDSQIGNKTFHFQSTMRFSKHVDWRN